MIYYSTKLHSKNQHKSRRKLRLQLKENEHKIMKTSYDMNKDKTEIENKLFDSMMNDQVLKEICYHFILLL